MTTLSEKLQKRLDALKAAGGLLPWADAPKQHKQLLQLGLVVEGRLDEKRYAVLAELADKEGDEC